MIVQHKLGICQAWLTFHSQLIHEMGNLSRLDFLHYEVENVGLVRRVVNNLRLIDSN
jgi:hypothetical protein